MRVEHRPGGAPDPEATAFLRRHHSDRVARAGALVDALRFYQRRGYRLVGLRPGAVEQARRTLKPAIPPVGRHGIALRDELELERPL